MVDVMKRLHKTWHTGHWRQDKVTKVWAKADQLPPCISFSNQSKNSKTWRGRDETRKICQMKTLPNTVKYDEQITANNITIGYKKVSQLLTFTSWDKALYLYSIQNLQRSLNHLHIWHLYCHNPPCCITPPYLYYMVHLWEFANTPQNTLPICP